jgi:hypothetical protein
MNEQMKTEEKQENTNWFSNYEVLYLPTEKQRSVIVNQGYQKEWFRKTYPTGELVLTHKVYEDDLPRNCKGKIIAVTAIPTIARDRFEEIKRNTKDYRELSLRGLLKPQPQGTFYELFESEAGFRIWVQPKDYSQGSKKNNNRRNNEVTPRTNR